MTPLAIAENAPDGDDDIGFVHCARAAIGERVVALQRRVGVVGRFHVNAGGAGNEGPDAGEIVAAEVFFVEEFALGERKKQNPGQRIRALEDGLDEKGVSAFRSVGNHGDRLSGVSFYPGECFADSLRDAFGVGKGPVAGKAYEDPRAKYGAWNETVVGWITIRNPSTCRFELMKKAADLSVARL